MCLNSHFSIGITASIWTVVQTSIHIIWAMCGYYFYVCKIKPTYYGLVILYLTYFYKDECGNITLKCDELVESDTKKSIILNSDGIEDANLFDIIQTILDNGILPKESNAAYRTHVYFNAFIISDAAWIISAFLLFAGTCFQIKKCLSLLFYCPWLVVSACVILLDVISSVHFGLDILKIQSFTTWLKFIGVQNYQDFSEYNKHNLSYIIPMAPALSLCFLFSRALVLWIWNIVLFVQVINIAVLAFQDNLDSASQSKTGRRKTRGNLKMDSSSSRIRNWQLFYGAIESSSTSSKSSERDSNDNNTMRRTSTKVKISDARARNSPSQSSASLDSYDYIASIRSESMRMKPEISTYYHRYTDVAESFDKTLDRGVTHVNPRKNQLLSSYFNEQGERPHSHSDFNISEDDFSHYGMSVESISARRPMSTYL